MFWQRPRIECARGIATNLLRHLTRPSAYKLHLACNSYSVCTGRRSRPVSQKARSRLRYDQQAEAALVVLHSARSDLASWRSETVAYYIDKSSSGPFNGARLCGRNSRITSILVANQAEFGPAIHRSLRTGNSIHQRGPDSLRDGTIRCRRYIPHDR